MKRASSSILSGIVAILGLAMPARAEAPPGHYTVSADTVRDNATQLTWQRRIYVNASACADDPACVLLAATCGADAQCTQPEGIAYCEALVLGEHDDFRLPTVRELLSIVDPTRSAPAIDAKAFPDTLAAPFWTSSAVRVVSGEAWRVRFTSGSTERVGPGEETYVRCVRG